MRKFLALAFVTIALSSVSWGQRDGIHVDQFDGTTVGAKATRAQNACTDVTQPCVIVFDPSLSTFPTGSLPSVCSNCVWIRYDTAAQLKVSNLTVTGTCTGCGGGSGTSAGNPLDLQFAGAGNTFDADTGQLTVDKTNHRLCVNWSGGFCDNYSYKAGANAMSLTGAFGNGKIWSDAVNHRMFADEGTWNVSAGKGIASFAAQAIVQGSAGADHLASFEAIPIFNISTLPIGNVYSFYHLPTVNAGATATQIRGLDCEPVAGSGTVGTNECIYAAADAKGSSNWFIVSDKNAPSYEVGQHYFGGVGNPSEDVQAAHGVGSVYHRFTESTAPSAGGAVFYADSSDHSVKLATNGSSNFGMLNYTVASVTQFNTGAFASTNVCPATAGNCNQSGTYLVTVTLWGSGTACTTPGPGTVSAFIGWTDVGGNAHSVSVATMAFASTLGGEQGSGVIAIGSNGAAAITYSATYTACTTGTGTYGVRVNAIRIQ